MYQPRERLFQIEDCFTEKTDNIHTYFHLDAALLPRVMQGEIRFLKGDTEIAKCTFTDTLQPVIEKGWIAKSYGVKETASVIHFVWNAWADQPAVFTFTAITSA